jgi:hypothetical protein
MVSAVAKLPHGGSSFQIILEEMQVFKSILSDSPLLPFGLDGDRNFLGQVRNFHSEIGYLSLVNTYGVILSLFFLTLLSWIFSPVLALFFIASIHYTYVFTGIGGLLVAKSWLSWRQVASYR